MIISGYLLVVGSLNVNKTGASVLAGLPIDNRDQAKASMKWVYYIQPIAYLVPNLFVVTQDYFWKKMLFDSVMIVYSIIIAFYTLELKVYLFGKMKYKYVLDEVNLEKKATKWVIFGVASIGWVIGLTVLTVSLYESDLFTMYLYLLPIAAGLAVGAIYIFNKMFPKHQTR